MRLKWGVQENMPSLATSYNSSKSTECSGMGGGRGERGGRFPRQEFLNSEGYSGSDID